jgi:hypothetical protein
MLMRPYRFVVAGGSLLLDTYSTDAAYSVRLIRTAYSGALVRIRRSSDSAEKDFYPDGSNELSMSSEDGAATSLSTWISTDSGYIVKWYNQGTGGSTYDLDQTTAGDQPRIVNAGSLEVQNGKASINFTGANERLVDTSSDYDGSTLDSFFLVWNCVNTNSRIMTTDASSSGLRNISSNTIKTRGTSDITIVGSGTTQGQTLYTSIAVDPCATYYDNNAGSTGNQGSYINGKLTFGNTSNAAGYLQEAVLYTTDQTSNRVAIQTDINGHYSIW